MIALDTGDDTQEMSQEKQYNRAVSREECVLEYIIASFDIYS